MITLLAACLYHEARRSKRNALADRIQASFLTSIDYETDEITPRVILSDSNDDAALGQILEIAELETIPITQDEGVASNLITATIALQDLLRLDLAEDPFKRLGLWADYLTKRVCLAVFIHPSPSSAYRVFEVINTHGKEFTTADLPEELCPE